MILQNQSVDCIIFGFKDNKLNILLWQVEPDAAKIFFSTEDDYDKVRSLYENNPMHSSENYWALIGSHLPDDKDLDEFAELMLQRTTGLKDVFLKQVKTFGSLKRVPYSRVLTTAYYAIINPEYQDMKQSGMAKVLRWFEVEKLPKMLFDHAGIIQEGIKKLRTEVMYHPVGFHLLPDKFTLTELQSLYEVILNTKLDTRNFRKKINNMELLVDTDEKQKGVAHRAAKLYSFDIEIYNRLKEEGLNFRI